MKITSIILSAFLFWIYATACVHAAEAPHIFQHGFYMDIYNDVSKNVEKSALENMSFSMEMEMEELQKQLIDFVVPPQHQQEYASSELIQQKIRLIERFNFEKELADFKSEISQTLELDEMFFNGKLGDTGIENDYDIVRDLEMVHFLLFGTIESVNLSPGGGLPGGESGNSGAQGSPHAVLSQQAGQPVGQAQPLPVVTWNNRPFAGYILDGSSRDFEIPQSTSGSPGSSGSVAVGAQIAGMQCALRDVPLLDEGPARELEAAEKQLAQSLASSAFRDRPVDPDSYSGGAFDALDFSSVDQGDISLLFASARQNLLDRLPPPQRGENQVCVKIDFDIEFCIDAQFGNYPAPKVYQDKSCILCLIEKINLVFENQLMPYSLRAKKNSGMIGEGGYCGGALDPEPAFQFILVPKPVVFENSICPQNPLKEERAQAVAQQAMYLKRMREARNPDEKEAIRNMMLRDLNAWFLLKSEFEEITGCEYPIGETSPRASFDSLVTQAYGTDTSDSSDSEEKRIAEKILQLDSAGISEALGLTSLQSQALRAQKEISLERHVRLGEAEYESEFARVVGIRIEQMSSYFDSILKALVSLQGSGADDKNSILWKLENKPSP